MDKATLNEAIAEAKRFLKAAQALQLEVKENDSKFFYASPKTRGQAKRASMDLTRSLAEFRKVSMYG